MGLAMSINTKALRHYNIIFIYGTYLCTIHAISTCQVTHLMPDTGKQFDFVLSQLSFISIYRLLRENYAPESRKILQVAHTFEKFTLLKSCDLTPSHIRDFTYLPLSPNPCSFTYSMDIPHELKYWYNNIPNKVLQYRETNLRIHSYVSLLQ